MNVKPHRTFKRNGSDIHFEVQVGAVEAMLGTELSVPTLYGEVRLNLPAGTQPGQVFRVKEKGLPRIGGRGRGDEYVTINVVVPKNLTGPQKELLHKFLDEGHGRNL